MSETPAPQHIEGDVILEPGDPGYTPPPETPTQTEGVPPDQHGEGVGLGPTTQDQQTQQDVIAPGPNETMSPPGPPGEDLTHQRQAGETDAVFMSRTRNTVVDSQSPTDIVPNTPQTTMGARVPIEGSELLTSVPSEEVPESAPEGATVEPREGEAVEPAATEPAEEKPA